MSKNRNKIAGQFAPRLVEMLESPAYRALSLSGHRVLSRIEIEHAHHGGKENGKLPITFDHFVEYGLHRHSVAPGMREVVALGFAVITEKGRGGNAQYRSPNKFRLTYRHADGIAGDGSHEWRLIKTAEEAEAIADAARKAKAPKKTKSQCRNLPAFSAKNRHRKAEKPVPKTGTMLPAKTITTSISRDIHPAEPAREARPQGSAVASGQAARTPECPPDTVGDDVLQARIAARLGRDGYEILQQMSDQSLSDVMALARAGALENQTLEIIRLQFRRGAA